MEKMRGGSGLTMNYEPRTLNCSALRCLAGLLHLAGAEASGTDVDMTGGAVDQRVDPVNVWELSPFAHVVGMADAVAEGRTFPAEITALRHRGSLEGDVGLLQPSTLYSISR